MGRESDSSKEGHRALLLNEGLSKVSPTLQKRRQGGIFLGQDHPFDLGVGHALFSITSFPHPSYRRIGAAVWWRKNTSPTTSTFAWVSRHEKPRPRSHHAGESVLGFLRSQDSVRDPSGSLTAVEVVGLASLTVPSAMPQSLPTPREDGISAGCCFDIPAGSFPPHPLSPAGRLTFGSQQQQHAFP